MGTSGVFAAIDVGANAVRLKIVRRRPGGRVDSLLSEREPVRPGEGVFSSGRMAAPVADRLMAVLRQYAALCRRHGAQVRVVATSALREAANAPEIVGRVQAETGLSLEIVSGQEEARLICLGALEGA